MKSIWILVLLVMAMLVLGMVTLFSASAFALDAHGDPYYFIKRQVIWLIIGATLCGIVAAYDYRKLERYWWMLYVLVIVLLILCFIPPIGMKINGSWRWINLGPVNFQPSELAKVVCALVLAAWFSRHSKHGAEFWKGFVLPGMLIAVPVVLIALETDLGTTALIGAMTFIVMFVAGTSPRYLGPLTVAGLFVVLLMAWQLDERVARLLAFMDLEQHRLGAGMQQWQALIAFGSGGIEGLGLGNGRQKMLYVPYAHTDFILPMIGEELGLIATLGVVLAYLGLILTGGLIAIQAQDKFGLLLGFGLVANIALQAAVNIGVTTALLPNTGLPLPFISYGGSNLVMCLISVGLLLSIQLHQQPARRKSSPVKAVYLRVINRI